MWEYDDDDECNEFEASSGEPSQQECKKRQAKADKEWRGLSVQQQSKFADDVHAYRKRLRSQGYTADAAQLAAWRFYTDAISLFRPKRGEKTGRGPVPIRSPFVEKAERWKEAEKHASSFSYA